MHLTTGILSQQEQEAFVNFCNQQGVKPLLIELARGDYTQQPMLSEIVYLPGLEDALQRANQYSQALRTSGFAVTRLKIEVPATKASLFAESSTNFQRYFEWHGKVDYARVDDLLALCTTHEVHLSRNALKNEANTRFVTLREYGNFETFVHRRNQLITTLTEGAWNLRKQQSEYCVYDNNVFLDSGWLVI
ncbi:hypothetical protein BKI52_13865 [marine bacterium AO1-C]|nr:hypothetical protein BKI52_13865 [marine bacterium AO1-C]